MIHFFPLVLVLLAAEPAPEAYEDGPAAICSTDLECARFGGNGDPEPVAEYVIDTYTLEPEPAQ